MKKPIHEQVDPDAKEQLLNDLEGLEKTLQNIHTIEDTPIDTGEMKQEMQKEKEQQQKTEIEINDEKDPWAQQSHF